MAEFNLIKIEGKPLEKLLDVIGDFIGSAKKPKQIRKEADAKAYEMVKLAEAKTQALEIEQKAEEDRLDRAQERIYTREIMRQINIEAVASNAAEILKIESDVSDEPVDKDWTARFFNIVEDVSDEQMQLLWGKILAGEVKRPKSFSLHTLEVLKNLSKEEANLFAKVANLVIYHDNSAMIYQSNMLEKYGLSFDERMTLMDLGLIQPDKDICFIFNSNRSGETILNSGKYVVRSTKKRETPGFQIDVFSLTRAGIELSKLLTTVANDEYIREFCSLLKNGGLAVEYAFSIDNEGNSVKEDLLWHEFAPNQPFMNS